MAKIDGYTIVKSGKNVRMVKLQCDDCGFEWTCAETGMNKLESLYAGHICNNCIDKKTRTAVNKWKKA